MHLRLQLRLASALQVLAIQDEPADTDEGDSKRRRRS